MKQENIKALENLSLFCHFSGVISIFLGIIVIFMDLLNNDFGHIQVGIFIFIVGYAFFKISTKLNNILFSEKTQNTDYF